MEKDLWENLRAMLFHYRWRFAAGLVMVVISNATAVFIPLVFRHAVIQMYPQEGTQEGGLARILQFILGSHANSITAWAFLLLALAIVAAYFKYWMRFAFISISRDAEKEVRSKIFGRIQEQSMAFYDKHGIGELLSRLTNDISAYRDVLGPGIMYPLYFMTLVIPGFAALYSISPILATVAFVPLLAIPILNYAMKSAIYAASLKAQKGLADLSSMVQEHYAGIRIVKGYGAEHRLSHLFSALGRSLVSINIRLSCYQGLMYPFFTLLTKVITITLVIFTGLVIINAWEVLNAADFVSFMWIQSYIFFPVLMLAWVLPMYARGSAAYDRLLEIYREPIEVRNAIGAKRDIPPDADIEFRHLTFSYPTAPNPVLKDFSLHIKSGSFVGITGPIGAGKTTLFRLLNREYEVPPGTIFIGGRDIHEYPLEAFGKEIVTVEQLPFLFSRTIADNVRFGREEALIEEIEMVSKYADLHETVVEFPESYETLIGERGVTLSGGQKQRVAIARAFLVNRSILLLDDVFSAVDSKTEARIFESMKAYFKNKTMLLITHRMTILEATDRVIYMEDGQVVEEGTPEELKRKKGRYAALAELQRLQK